MSDVTPSAESPGLLGLPFISDSLQNESPSVTNRRRRHHPKSRLGCTACRKRKVKCDEAHPTCGNCQRRSETCSLEELYAVSRSKILRPRRLWLDPNPGNGFPAQINMLHMKLLHHFNNVTAETLIFDTSIWKNDVPLLAFQHEFLMHAVLLISASHLCFLNPGDSIYEQASMSHLSETLRLFRQALAQPVNVSNADAFMATSTLLVHHAWASVDNITTPRIDNAATQGASDLSFGSDPLFTLSLGLRQVFQNSFQLILKDESIFAASSRHRPRHSLERATSGHFRNLQELEMLISRVYCERRAIAGNPILESEEYVHSDSMELFRLEVRRCEEMGCTATKFPDEDGLRDAEMTGFADATSRLLLVLGLLQQQSQLNDSSGTFDVGSPHSYYTANGYFPPLADLARFLFSFPTRSSNSFIRMSRQNNPCALLILFFYYRAVEQLLPYEQCWWSRRRAQVLGPAIERALRAETRVDLSAVLHQGKSLLGNLSY